jgi:Flp pilus assembly protein TadG
VSAVEFAMIAPIMILLYYGLAEITMAMMAERRASHAASAIGDLVTQDTAVTPAEVDDIFKVANQIVYPFPTASLKMRVTSVKADASAVPKVVWSRGQGLTALSVNATVTGLPANFLAAGESTVMTEVQYPYDTPLKQVIPRTLNFNEKTYLRPRRSTEVTCPSACV